MQVALNLRTININDQEVARFIQNKNVDEIKALFVNFLKNQITTHQTGDSLDSRLKNLKMMNPEKSKRVREALDSLNKKLEPLKNINIELEKNRYIKEKFSLWVYEYTLTPIRVVPAKDFYKEYIEPRGEN